MQRNNGYDDMSVVADNDVHDALHVSFCVCALFVRAKGDSDRGMGWKKSF